MNDVIWGSREKQLFGCRGKLVFVEIVTKYFSTQIDTTYEHTIKTGANLYSILEIDELQFFNRFYRISSNHFSNFHPVFFRCSYPNYFLKINITINLFFTILRSFFEWIMSDEKTSVE